MELTTAQALISFRQELLDADVDADLVADLVHIAAQSLIPDGLCVKSA